MILDTGLVDLRSPDDAYTYLEYAVENCRDEWQEGDSEDYVKDLLDAGADPNWPNHEGGTAMHACAAHGFVTSLDTLLKHGGDIEVTDQFGNTPFLSAISCGKFDFACNLMAMNCNIHVRCSGSKYEQNINRGALDYIKMICDKSYTLHNDYTRTQVEGCVRMLSEAGYDARRDLSEWILVNDTWLTQSGKKFSDDFMTWLHSYLDNPIGLKSIV